MTNEEAIKIIKAECYVFNPLNFDRTQMVNTALDMACKSLEQTDLDKIRAEILQVANQEKGHDEKWALGLRYAIKIIDKYKSESEG